ncbi:MAG: CDP-glycerol glycerophosphotransferase family protein [Candidatus Colwellbacteria bacterium]|nr:CDP-glycerol glycerophosphotransferase family protein [Candidatus Colwellbacteria bacterium]
MKTIFISLFEGVEAKNILRTSILPVLLSQPDIRLVLFTKSRERAEYHKKEFRDPRIIFEVVSLPPPRGLDAVFMRLKFTLLRTPTTILMRKKLFEARGNFVNYRAASFLNWVFARPFFVRLARAADFLFVKNRAFAPSFEKYQPDLVFCANLFDDTEIHMVREAKKVGVKTIGLINSWDRTTTRCILRLLPDMLICFSECIQSELVRHDAIAPHRVYVGGIPHYDYHFSAPHENREEFCKKTGLDPAKRFIVFAPFGIASSDSDWDIIDMLYRLNREGEFGNNVEVFVRFPPNDVLEKEELEKRPYLKYDHPGILFTKQRSIDWDLDADGLKYLSDTLYHSAMVLTYASSISIDAAAVGRPVININFEMQKPGVFTRSPTFYYKKEYYQKALRTGGIRLVNSEKELAFWVQRYLKNPSYDKENREHLVREQCQFTDGKSGERVGKYILGYLFKTLT